MARRCPDPWRPCLSRGAAWRLAVFALGLAFVALGLFEEARATFGV